MTEQTLVDNDIAAVEAEWDNDTTKCGFSLIVTEAAAVTADGRISDRDAGIWNDEQATGWKRITDYVHSHGAAIAIQLAHAGAKASTYGWLKDLETVGKVGSIPENM